MSRIHKPGERVESWGDQLEYNQAIDHSVSEDYKHVLEILRTRVGESLLDVGCGNGRMLIAALTLGLNSTGIEDTPEAAAVSQKVAPDAKIVVGSDVELPFEDNYFDLITALSFVDYFPDPGEGFEEIRRVLKLGGRTCILLPNADFVGAKHKYLKTRDALNETVMTFPLKVWKKMIEDSGMRIVTVHPSMPRLDRDQSQGWRASIARIIAYLLWRIMPLKWSYQFVCYCYKD
jgi:ubiquinone/menaquinone biosynthesis C-methylase UbiE